jgi:hypothetical protein
MLGFRNLADLPGGGGFRRTAQGLCPRGRRAVRCRDCSDFRPVPHPQTSSPRRRANSGWRKTDLRRTHHSSARLALAYTARHVARRTPSRSVRRAGSRCVLESCRRAGGCSLFALTSSRCRPCRALSDPLRRRRGSGGASPSLLRARGGSFRASRPSGLRRGRSGALRERRGPAEP